MEATDIHKMLVPTYIMYSVTSQTHSHHCQSVWMCSNSKKGDTVIFITYKSSKNLEIHTMLNIVHVVSVPQIKSDRRAIDTEVKHKVIINLHQCVITVI